MENEEISFVGDFDTSSMYHSPCSANSVANSPFSVYSCSGSEEPMDTFGVIREVREGLDNFTAKGKRAPFKVRHIVNPDVKIYPNNEYDDCHIEEEFEDTLVEPPDFEGPEEDPLPCSAQTLDNLAAVFDALKGIHEICSKSESTAHLIPKVEHMLSVVSRNHKRKIFPRCYDEAYDKEQRRIQKEGRKIKRERLAANCEEGNNVMFDDDDGSSTSTVLRCNPQESPSANGNNEY